LSAIPVVPEVTGADDVLLACVDVVVDGDVDVDEGPVDVVVT
jgi:hypothetical protein